MKIATPATKGVGAAALATLGMLAATPFATADGPVPTVTVPTGITITVPTVSLPTTTGATTQTTTPATTTAVTQTVTSPGATTSGTGTPTTKKGAASTSEVKLRSGAISVTAESVSPPTRLLIAQLRFAPRVLSHAGRVTVSVEIRDTKHHVVRGVQVVVRASRGNGLALTTTRVDGRATLRFFVSRAVLRAGSSLSLVVRAATSSLRTQRTVHVVIRRAA
jgi:hypothetical protein